ncbi:MAG: S8 family serine peptidase [Ardenticatenaceae bacterium]|nr:S8 family serine peptidase [Ardenticatenaceae bacterium]
MLSLLAMLGLLVWLLAAPSPAQANDKITADLQTAVATANPNTPLRFIVHFQETADFSRTPLPTDEIERRTLMVQTLQETAVTSQAALISQLDDWQANGRIRHYRPLWIINAIAIVGTADTIPQIATRPEVKQIELDNSFPLIPAFADPDYTALFQFLPANPPTETYSWGLDRIRAPHVWHGLGYDGSDVTIAIMDSGVDWQHPDLLPNYRGNLGGGSYQHAGNWYQATYPTLTVPVDWVGHGTHVAGTAVGQNGIGVAPGANWIATAIVDQYGNIYTSSAHAAFQWLLAPNNNPALAPDIVNASWGGSPIATAFLDDVEILYQAGIIAVFAAGNSGPFAQTIGTPAAYTHTLAIGASDEFNTVAWFSSRGPSTFTSEPRPHLIAPGTNIVSAYLNNQYALSHGTSMAAPHAAGAAALLLSQNPALTIEDVKQRLLASALPVAANHPNNESGWGQLDIYNTLLQEVATGRITGQLQGDGVPLPHTLMTITTPSGAKLPYTTDDNGQFEMKLQPGTYSLQAAAFGFASQTKTNLTIFNINHTVITNFDLSPLPAGIITGQVREAGTNNPIANAEVRVEGAPVTAQTDANGQYTLNLPANQYTISVHAHGYRLGQTAVTLTANQTIIRHFTLAPGPAIILVDSGTWYYDSQIHFYENSLTSLAYNYDVWSIRHPYQDVPEYDDLADYDTLIWSAPFDSPGAVQAGQAITRFLKTGGNFLVSGQNVGAYDSIVVNPQVWWYRDLEARYAGNVTHTETIMGAAGTVFAGLSLTLNGAESAHNQFDPDKSLSNSILTDPIFHYGSGPTAALQTGHCKPFNIVYLGFGLEGVSTEANRQQILERTFDYFDRPLITSGVRWETADIDEFALPTQQLVYTITVRNMSETLTDTFHIQTSGSQWPTDLMTTTVTLGPCAVGHTVLTLNVPADVPPDTQHTMSILVAANSNPALTDQFYLHHKIPGQILFIDDDRWYDRQGTMLDALDQMGLSYDIWETGWASQVGRGSPPADLLLAYDYIIWYTGYDWFQPLTNEENAALTNFLAQGGRLFLTSQDYLYYHAHQPLVKNYFGLLTYQESITPTQVYAGHSPVVPNELAGPIPLSYRPYLNFSDGVLPLEMERAVLWGDQGMPAGLINSGFTADNEDWRLVFWSIPFETMTHTAYLPAMNGIMGWLGDLGDSTFATGQRVVPAGAAQTYTLTLKNLPHAPANYVYITNTLPVGLDFVAGSLSGGASYNAATRQLTWQGDLPPGGQRLIRYQAVPTGGPRLDNRVTIAYERHKIAFNQTATVWVDAPDLSGSQLTAVSNTPATSPHITYSLRLQNDGLLATDGISAVVRLPNAFYPLTDTLAYATGTGFLANQRIHWRGDLLPGEAVTITFQMTGTLAAKVTWHSATAVIHDGHTDTQLFYHVLPIRPFTYYWPFVAKQ